MGGVYCPRCKTQVTLEQDGRSCSNCGRILVAPVPEDNPPPPPKPKARPKKSKRR